MKLVKEKLDEAIKHLEGRPKKEVDDNINNDLLKRLSTTSDAEELKYYLENIYKTDFKQILVALIDAGIDAGDILISIVDEIDLDNAPKEPYEKQRWMKYREYVMKIMYKVIEKNKDKIDLNDLL